MYDLDNANIIYKEKLKSNPDFANELVIEWRDKMPEQFSKRMYEAKYGHHIVTEDIYDKAVSLLKWQDNKGTGEKWTVEDITKTSGIDFDDKNYYEYDYAYVVNMLYSDYCNVFTDQSYYLKMAKAYLEDPDYMGDPSERAYHNAMKRIKYAEENED